LIETTTFPRNNGDLVVFTASGFSLVDRTANEMTHTAVGNLTTSSTYASGNLTGVFLGGEAADNDITNRVTGGALSALIKQRDDVLPNLQSQLDELATELRDAVNAVHNRGTTYPGLQSMSGNRKFIDADAQTITLDPTNSTDDVTIAMFDSSGLQLQSTTLNTIMMAGEYGTGIQSDHGPWTITEVAATVEDWLQANGASSATVGISSSTGKMDISLNDSTVYMAFRDEVATAEGSAAGDAEIGFDSDADGDVDETVSGFSSFFRLNDLYVDDTNGALLESVQLSDNFSSSVSTLTFYDGTAGVGSGNALGSVSFTKNQSLTSMVKSINDASLGITASITPDGSGSRLRLLHDAGLELVVTQGSSDSILEATGLAPSNSRSATSIAVRDDIAATPGLVTTAQMQFDTTKGRYMINAGDNTIIQDLAEMLSAKNVFDAAGGLNGATRTFEEFSIDILSRQANLADTNESQLATQLGLTESLELEASRISGVNMDEEMANLIVYQQSFSAAARVISVIQEMFKTLEQAVG